MHGRKAAHLVHVGRTRDVNHFTVSSQRKERKNKNKKAREDKQDNNFDKTDCKAWHPDGAVFEGKMLGPSRS